ncbi:MAG: hypothetical protein GY723_23510 [bacterium]|nr:hypothetical protein [bacterium]MCP5070647.1 hypothetical protein [bacterium]
MSAPSPGATWTRYITPILGIAALAYVVLLHHGLGPNLALGGNRWWMPSGFLSDVAPESLGVGLALFGLIAVALAWALFQTSRSSVLRWLAISQVLAVGLVVSFGIGSSMAWSFFHWRWSVSLGLLALAVGAALTAPLLAGAWSRLPGWARFASYTPVFLGLVAFERNVTGTDPMLPFAISPWPVVQIFGLEVLGSWLATTWLGAGVGLIILGHEPRSTLRSTLAVAAAVAIPLCWLGFGGHFALLPFRTGAAAIGLAALVVVLLLGALAWAHRKPDEATPSRVRAVLLGGLLASAPLLLGQTLTLLDYQTTREESALAVTDALQRFIDREGTFPDKLDELVVAGDLEEVPSPRIGLLSGADETFSYQSFGTGYILEFSAPRWIQCAYNPPWADDLSEEERAEFEAEDVELGGAWSCPSKPPELW